MKGHGVMEGHCLNHKKAEVDRVVVDQIGPITVGSTILYVLGLEQGGLMIGIF